MAYGFATDKKTTTMNPRLMEMATSDVTKDDDHVGDGSTYDGADGVSLKTLAKPLRDGRCFCGCCGG